MSKKPDKLTRAVANIAEAEIGRLKARIAELEAEVACWRAGERPAKPPVTLEQSGLSDRVTPPRPTQSFQVNREHLRRQEMRNAVKEAEQEAERQWRRAPRSQTVDSPEARVAGHHWEHPLEKAKVAARAAARDELRARWAVEDAEAKAVIDLPAHIVRMP